MKLYDFRASGNGYRVRLTLTQLGRRFDYQEVDILTGETRQPWFLAKNPAGQIPVLELPSQVSGGRAHARGRVHRLVAGRWSRTLGAGATPREP